MSRLVLLLGEDFCQCQSLFSDLASELTRDQVDVAPSSRLDSDWMEHPRCADVT